MAMPMYAEQTKHFLLSEGPQPREIAGNWQVLRDRLVSCHTALTSIPRLPRSRSRQYRMGVG